jgi:hypothetical protein
MKYRNGFVSNSSSSSFIIKKNKLTKRQIEQIKNYQEEAAIIGEYCKLPQGHCGACGKFGYIDDHWQITETMTEIKGNTIMDNFNFDTYLKEIGVKDEDIAWGGW